MGPLRHVGMGPVHVHSEERSSAAAAAAASAPSVGVPGVPYYQRLLLLCAELFERRFDSGKHEMGEGPGGSAAWEARRGRKQLPAGLRCSASLAVCAA